MTKDFPGPRWAYVVRGGRDDKDEKWANVPAVFLSELDGDFTLKEETRAALKHFVETMLSF